MVWYSNMAHFATGQFVRRDGRPRAGSATPTDSSSYRDESGPQPEHQVFEPMAPLPASALRLEASAVDRLYIAFDVSQPVEQPEDLRGRDLEVQALLSGVLHRRNHGIVSGPRGSGKTSLVRVFGQYADREGVVVLYSACDDGTSFGELIRSYLEQVPSAMVDAGSIELFAQRVLSFGAESSPYQATGLFAMLKYSQLVVVLDEFDRITDPSLHDKISSLLKLVSDARLPVRFVLVGGNSAFADIVRIHPSLMRHISRVSTAPLSGDAIDELLSRCAERCGISFTASSMSLIKEVACGSPYHARLFGMHGAMTALADHASEVDLEHVESGLEDAFEEWSMLNPVDARAFKEFLQGSHGPANELVELARQAARQYAHDDFAVHWETKRAGPVATGPEGLAKLSQTVQVVDGHATFRDATAPQFLLALDHIQRLVSNIKGGKRA